MTAADLAGWWLYVARVTAAELWRSRPGPWPVKALLVVACVAIPGPFDEVALVAITAAWRKRKSRTS